MSEDSGNYSFYNHNLRRPTLQPNRLYVRQSSSENALNNFQGLSIISPTLKSDDEPQFAGEPLVSSYVPHPPSVPRSKRSTPIRFRAQKRSRHESPRTSDDEKISRKQLQTTSNSRPVRSSSASSLEEFNSDPEIRRRRHFLEPLNTTTTQKELVSTFKVHQHQKQNESNLQPLRAVRDKNGDNNQVDLRLNKTGSFNDKNIQNNEKTSESNVNIISNENSRDSRTTASTSTKNYVEENSTFFETAQPATSKTQDVENDRTVSISDDDSFTNVSQSDDDDETLSSSSSESDEELKKKSEQIAEALLSKRYPNATLPSIPKGTTNDITHYETMDANISTQLDNTYESVPGFEKPLNGADKQTKRHSSDADLSTRGGSEFSYSSQTSLLPRVLAKTVKLRNTNFLQEELDKHFPEGKVTVFVATWNMHEEKVG